MKRNILLLLYILTISITSSLKAQTITAEDLTLLGGLTCNTNVQATFTTTGTFNAGNIFTLEVSDENGDFTTPSVTATTTTVPAFLSSITLTVPSSYPSGNGYKLRVKSSDPVIVSTPVSTAMPIIQPPAIKTVTATPTEVLYGESSTIEIVDSQNGIEYKFIRFDAPSTYHAGTGSTFSFSTGTLTQTVDYYVEARYPSVTTINCSTLPFNFPNPTVSVTVYSTQVNGVRYENIQDAINAIPANTAQTIEILAERIYDEDIVIDGNKNLTFTSSVTDYKDLVIKSIEVEDGSSLTIDGNMSVAGMFAMKGNADVTVNAGRNFALLSDTDQTAMIYNGSPIKTIVGDVITERFTPDPTTIPGFTGTYSGKGYHMFSSPFKDAKVSDFNDDMPVIVNPNYNASNDPAYTTPFPNFYRYDETRTGSASASGYYSAFTMGYEVPTLSDDLEIGRGYEVNLGTGTTIDLQGELNNGDITIPLSNTENSYNLIGNPYPSPIDWSAVYNLGTNAANVEPSIYIDIKTGEYATSYAIFNGLTGIKVNGGQENIAMMQGFFVKALGATPELVMDNSVRPSTYENTRFFKTKATEIVKEGVIKLGIFSEGNMDETAIGFIEGATSDYDYLYDAKKIHKINGYAPTLYSYNEGKDKENEYYAINVLPEFDENMVLPLGMNIIKGGRHKIVVREIKYFHSLSNVYLYDSLTETLHDLKANPEYEFVAEAGTEVKRFAILFKANDNFTQKDHIVVYPNPTANNFSYSLKNDREGSYTVRLFDATGKLILEKTEEKQGAFLEGTISLETEPKGLYLLQISNGKSITVSRILKE